MPESDEAEATRPVEPEAPGELTEWERKRRLAEIFGDVLPSTTKDERGPGADEAGESANDAWLRRQVPPHHGG